MPPFDKDLANVYLGVVILTGIAPLILSIAALFYWWICRRESRTGVIASPRSASQYKDGCSIVLMTLLPQALVLLIPCIYPKGPGTVPRPLAEGAIMAATCCAVLWAWAWWNFIRAGVRLPFVPTRMQALGLALPVFVSLGAIAAVVIGLNH